MSNLRELLYLSVLQTVEKQLKEPNSVQMIEKKNKKILSCYLPDPALHPLVLQHSDAQD